MSTPLDDVALVARSPHRTRVLETLAASASTRVAIHEVTEVPQPTLGRILGDFEDRGWVTRRGREYLLTPLGHLLAEEFTSLLDTVETIQDLRDAMTWLPTQEMDFDLRHFKGATITTPSESDSVAPIRRAVELTHAVDRLRFITLAVTPNTEEALRDAAVSGTRLEIVLSADAADVILADPQMTGWYEEIVRSEQAAVFRYDGTIPYILGVGAIDGEPRTAIGLIDATGAPRGYIDTDDKAVRSWADRIIDRYREEADRLGSEDFAGE